MMLPHVIRFNGEEFGNLYFELLECTAGGNGFPVAGSGYQGLADFVADLVSQRRTDQHVARVRNSARIDWNHSPPTPPSNGPPGSIRARWESNELLSLVPSRVLIIPRKR